MKKFFVSILATMMGFGAFAQEVAPNRILISDKSYNTKGYIVDNVDAITFATVEGEVAADVEILEVTSEALSVKVLRTEACQAFKLNVLPTVQIQNYSDAALVSAVDASTTNLYYQDFPSGLLDITSFEPNTAYTVVTVGFDMYGVPVEARKADFTTLATPIVGTPAVEVEVVDIQKSQFTLKFTPNADTSRYALCAGEKGTMQSQYEMFAPMFGYSNFGQMLEAWGVGFDEATEYTWTNMNPGTEYEVFIQTWDVNGTMADYSVYTVTTDSYGGEGTAEVAITIGKYELADWWVRCFPVSS